MRFILSSKTVTSRIIDATECIPDITENVIHDSEHCQIPSNIFEDVIFQALNELLDDFAENTEKYLKPCHETEIDALAAEFNDGLIH